MVVDKKIKTAARSVGRQTLRKQLGSGSGKRKGAKSGLELAYERQAGKVSPTKYAEQTNRSRRDIFIYIYHRSCQAIFGTNLLNLGGKIPEVNDVLSSHEQEIYPTTSLDENCIDFEFQTDRNYYVDLRQTFLALKLKMIKGRGYEICNPKESEKEHKDESKEDAAEDTADEEMEEDPPVLLVTHVNNVLRSIFSNVEVYINNQQIYYSNGF